MVTDHVKSEITDNFPEQLQSLHEGLSTKIIEEITVTEDAEIVLFSQLLQNRKLGIGECSAP